MYLQKGILKAGMVAGRIPFFYPAGLPPGREIRLTQYKITGLYCITDRVFWFADPGAIIQAEPGEGCSPLKDGAKGGAVFFLAWSDL